MSFAFTPVENLNLLKVITGLSWEKILDIVPITDKTLRRVLKCTPDEKRYWSTLSNIALGTSREIGLPWSKSTERVLQEMERLWHQENYPQFEANWIGIFRESSDPPRNWSYLVPATLALSRLITLPKWRAMDGDIFAAFDLHARVLEEKLQTEFPEFQDRGESWPSLLSLKLDFARLAILWNKTPAFQRADSDRLQREYYAFFPKLNAYVGLCPHNRPAVHSLVAMASRMNQIQEFERLFQQVLKTFGTADEFRKSIDRDTDFDNFLLWLDRRKEKK